MAEVVTLHMQFITDNNNLFTLSVPNPDKDRSGFAEEVNSAMDAVISKRAIAGPNYVGLKEKRRAWISDVTETDIPMM